MGFRNRLILFLIATLIGVQALTLLSAYTVVRQSLIGHGRENLAATSQAFMRQLQLLSERVSDGVQVLALDFPLRQAIAEKNIETVNSALRNHGWRIGASRMFLVGLDGAVTVDTQYTATIGKAFPFSDLLNGASRDGRAMGLAAIDGQIFWIVAVPVNAPLPISFIAAGVPVDDALIDKLRQVSVVPATIALALEKPGGGYALAARSGQRATGLHLPDGGEVRFGEANLVDDAGTEFLTLVTKLRTARNSPAVVAVFDYPLEDALGPFYDIVLPVAIALVVGLGIAILGAALIARGVSRPIEMLAQATRRIAGGDYTAPPVLTQRDEIGQLSGAIAVMTHAIGERQTQLEAGASALAFARDEAVRANAAKSQFLANMSHELRTPLNAVIGFGDMIHGELLGPVGNERYLEYARDIRDSGVHLLSLVEEILDLAKIEAGTLTLAKETTAPGETLKGVLPIVAAMADTRNVRLEIASGFEKWPVIDADPVKLKQVFINLISNAVKFTPEGGRVSVSAEWTVGSLVMRVADNGIGIKPADIPLIVQPFYRVSSALNSTYQGAGLGLALTKAIVDLHGGSLSIASEVGRGTTVTVVWPLADTSRSQDAA
jgi:signal transduction histidine kinase